MAAGARRPKLFKGTTHSLIERYTFQNPIKYCFNETMLATQLDDDDELRLLRIKDSTLVATTRRTSNGKKNDYAMSRTHLVGYCGHEVHVFDLRSLNGVAKFQDYPPEGLEPNAWSYLSYLFLSEDGSVLLVQDHKSHDVGPKEVNNKPVFQRCAPVKLYVHESRGGTCTSLRFTEPGDPEGRMIAIIGREWVRRGNEWRRGEDKWYMKEFCDGDVYE
ncbi:hypothetical protein HDV00_010119 [Rhizophlyctis rosea]|nr:hypothetical protein HDV00_010119 [Rhizophlyctis rosea]